MNNSRLTELLAAYADERISREELTELESLLMASADARRQFWGEMALHGLTREAAELKWAGQPVPAPQNTFFGAVKELFQPRWRIAWATGVAAVLVVGGMFLRQSAPPPESPLANLNPPHADIIQGAPELVGVRDRVTVSRNGGELAAAESFALQPGDTIRLGAQAQATIRYADATRFELRPGAILCLRGADVHELELTAGKLDAQVTRQPAGKQFVLRTPLASVTVHGTAFELAAAPRATRVDVSEGLVQVAHAQRDSSVELTAGEFAVAVPEHEIVAGLQPANAMPANYSASAGDVVRRPFAASSPWNTPIGSGAKFAIIESEVFDFPKHGAALLPARMDRPIFIAQPDDPQASVTLRYGFGELTALRLPASALPDSSRLVNCTVVDAQRGVAVELIQAGRDADGVAAMLSYTNDLRGEGVPPAQVGHTWSGMPLVAGIIRDGELTAGIKHVLAATVLHPGLSRGGADGQPYVWPSHHMPVEAKLIDHMAATGNVHFGTLLAIPPDVDITKLGVGTSGPAFEVARALQNYGAYVTHSYAPASAQGNWVQPHIEFFADGVADDEMRSLLPLISKLAPHLKVVANNSPQTPGGGGKPRR